jgi:hypothetical protein
MRRTLNASYLVPGVGARSASARRSFPRKCARCCSRTASQSTATATAAGGPHFLRVPDTLQLLSRYGADFGAPTARARRTAVHLAPSPTIIFYMVRVAGVDPNVRDRRSFTPLHANVSRGQMANVRALLSLGADPLQIDTSGRPAAAYAKDDRMALLFDVVQ